MNDIRKYNPEMEIKFLFVKVYRAYFYDGYSSDDRALLRQLNIKINKIIGRVTK